jgi:hypothetical protein
MHIDSLQHLRLALFTCVPFFASIPLPSRFFLLGSNQVQNSTAVKLAYDGYIVYRVTFEVVVYLANIICKLMKPSMWECMARILSRNADKVETHLRHCRR